MGTALAEGEVVDVGSAHVDAVRVLEVGVVPVAGGEPHDDLVALCDRLAAELDRARRRTTEVVDRAGPPQQLLEARRDERGVLLHRPQLVALSHQAEHGVADGLTRGLVAGDDEEQEVVVEVGVGERDPVHGELVGEDADQVCAIAALATVAESPSVVEDLLSRGRAERQVLVLLALRRVERELRVVRVGVPDHLVAPRDQLAGVLLGHVEQSRQHLDGEVTADLLDEVELLVLERLVDRLLGQLTQEALVVLHQVARTELARDERAHGLVPRAVRLEHRATQVPELGVDVLEVDELLGGEGLGVLVDGPDVVVAGHRPEAATRGLLAPVHRVLAAQRVELTPREVITETVQVGEVDLTQRDGLVLGHLYILLGQSRSLGYER